MGNTKAFFATGTTVFTAAITIVACGSDKAKPDAPIVIIDAPVDTPKPIDAAPDAPSFDFSCANNSAPTPNANVTVAGVVDQVGFSGGQVTFSALGSASVDLCKGNCNGGNNLGSGTTDGSGAFSIGPIATGGTAIDGYARVTKTGSRTILGFPASPVAADVVQPIITFQAGLIETAGGSFGCPQTAQNGMVAMFVTDCANNAINDSTNLTISVQENGSDVGDAPIDAGGLNQMAAGFFLICDVPPGTATVNAKYGNMTLRAHDVLVTAGTTTETIVRPGF